ncbi:uncharacterized protein BO80DRAFT_464592 [Aspergillus ibericus CBS 121593]|uniref:Uncharacterized protein n=1 Tax=Aspergillus ibericus CBS 121593 TaxID=1448316 RepID=A0A395H0L3_9EURO|nr:hypothetical protein BO80DRAFT_464592 [Aspergillus ibericus CBS 121593]RAL01336.1 hypothetical protein BO80DRAFT_464592 [Aspergillus ibericus CBS 121593]
MDAIADDTRTFFIDLCRRYRTNHEFLEGIYHILFGNRELGFPGTKTAQRRQLTNFAPLVPHMIMAKPDVVDGAIPQGRQPQMMDDLEDLIIPFVISEDDGNKEDENMMVAPNFFFYNRLEDKDGSAGSRAALHCGALGARAMHEIQCYGRAKSYDKMAYTYVAVLMTNHMTIYAIHPIESQAPNRETDYQMTQIKAFQFGKLDEFKSGIAAFRNLREHARSVRRRLFVNLERNSDDTSDDSNDSGGNGGGYKNNSNSDDQETSSSDSIGDSEDSENSTGQGTSASNQRESDPPRESSPPTKRVKIRLWPKP